jgi:hypothetical protein
MSAIPGHSGPFGLTRCRGQEQLCDRGAQDLEELLEEVEEDLTPYVEALKLIGGGRNGKCGIARN